MRVNGLWGTIDRNGNIVIRPDFDAVYTFVNGVAMVRLDGRNGSVFAADNRVISHVYTKAHDFKEGLAAVMQDDRWGFINMAAEMAIAPEYDSGKDFINGHAYVEIDDMECLIDRQGHRIGECSGIARYEFCYQDDPSCGDPCIRTSMGMSTVRAIM